MIAIQTTSHFGSKYVQCAPLRYIGWFFLSSNSFKKCAASSIECGDIGLPACYYVYVVLLYWRCFVFLKRFTTIQFCHFMKNFKVCNYGCVALPWHFEFYILKCKNLKCKISLIDFLDELGNFKQKKFYTSKCNFFFTFQNNRPLVFC